MAREVRIPRMRSAALRTVLLLIVLAIGVALLPAAAAQTVTITPAAPDPSSFVTVKTAYQTHCLQPARVTAANGIIRAVHLTDRQCVSAEAPVRPSIVPVGVLPAGTYTYELYAPDATTLVAKKTFTVASAAPASVAAASVPLTDSYGLAFLSALFVLAGAIAVGRVA
jgi:hypothetical protein